MIKIQTASYSVFIIFAGRKATPQQAYRAKLVNYILKCTKYTLKKDA